MGDVYTIIIQCIYIHTYIYAYAFCMLGEPYCIPVSGMAASCKHSTHCSQQRTTIPCDECAQEERNLYQAKVCRS